MLILSSILATTLVVMNRCIEAVIDLRSRERAFELARENLELLLTGTKVQDSLEYGFDELNPDIQWQLAVEPFYEPVSNRMWIRAVSSAEYTDSKGEIQTLELEHWITGLNAQQIKMIQAQQKLEEEFLKNLYGEEEAQRQELTKAFLEKKDLDVKAYEQLLARHRDQKLAYLREYGYDDQYEAFLEELKLEEDRFLVKQGIDWQEYQDFYNRYLGQAAELIDEQTARRSQEPQDTPDTAETDAGPRPQESPDLPGDLPPDVREMLGQ